MIVLGIETSCDETSAALYGDGGLLAHVVHYQVVHEEYGGVVPEFASRAHMRALVPAIRKVLAEAGIDYGQLGAVAVTHGPGLVGSLLVGLNVAKGLAVRLRLPLIGVNHIEGHLFANFLEEPYPELPGVCLVVSGGHTQLVLVPELGRYVLLGKTRDDAAGEAFDKVARILGLGYPGGPAIDAASESGDEEAIAFPRVLPGDRYGFSFSGLKTAVLYYFLELPEEERRQRVADIAASFQRAVVDVLVTKAKMACEEFGARSLSVAGGVARNRRLRRALAELGTEMGIPVFVPRPEFCTDNAAMIARAGFFWLQRGISSDLHLAPFPSLPLGES
ncbi:MAG: tRNA (adenosine(37)-N6)-threonylcarbamoyltransferase complex transferase subunit TsaD [candidate division KSB1 bacterium]|nr:tRNA (adenosine(37)-N6)-threonylcarbamoyltransferase complex transferase subunit TsaD [candidate division KSB1 bacterium]